MSRRTMVLGVAFLLAAGSAATAATIRPGQDPPDENVIWADPFDFYNQWAYDNQDNPAYSRGTVWQGGPIPAGDPSGGYPTKAPIGETFKQVDPNDHEMIREQWPKYTCGTITSPGGTLAFPGAIDGSVDPNYGGSGEWVETRGQYAAANYTWGTGGSYMSMTQFSHDFSDRIQAIADYHNLGVKNAIIATDEAPVVLVAYLRAHMGGSYDNFYIELSLNEDRAPTDYVWRGNRAADDPPGEYCPYGPYPVLCQQAREINSDACVDGADLTWLNDACPALSAENHDAFAFGFMAIMDPDPCKLACETKHAPTNNHLSVFDGNKWRQIRAGRYAGLTEPTPNATPGGTGSLVGNGTWPPENYMTGAGGASNDCSLSGTTNASFIFYVKIITDYVLIYMWDKGHPDDNWHAAIPRTHWANRPFNTIRLGVGPGCELDPETGTCKEGGTPYQCLTYGGTGTEGYGRIWADSLSLFTTGDIQDNLVFVSTDGACCKVDGTCEVLDEATCLAQNGRWDGANSLCGDFQCCPLQYGDTDHDFDVDQMDFALLQRCITTGDVTMQPECECLDTDGNNVIDATDVERFALCGSGPDIVADPGCKNW